MGRLVGAGTLATHLFFRVRMGLRTSVVVHGSGIGVRGRGHGIPVRRRRRIVGILPLMHGAERLAVSTVDGRWALLWIDGASASLGRHDTAGSEMRICGVRGDKSLRLRRHGREDAFLLESLAVGASSVVRRFEARAADLLGDEHPYHLIPSPPMRTGTHFASSAISTRDRRSLPGRWLVVIHVLLRTTAMGVLRMARIHVVRRMTVEVWMLLILWRG